MHGGDGANDAISHVKSAVSSCPNTKIVLGGYSQGASVIDIVAGVPIGGINWGSLLPPEYANNVAAVVTFGNVADRAGGALAVQSAMLGSKAIDLCNPNDPICHAGPGNEWRGHSEGYIPVYTTQAAAFVASKLLAGTGQEVPGFGPSVPWYGPQTPGYGPVTPWYGPQTPGYGPVTPWYGPRRRGTDRRRRGTDRRRRGLARRYTDPFRRTRVLPPKPRWSRRFTDRRRQGLVPIPALGQHRAVAKTVDSPSYGYSPRCAVRSASMVASRQVVRSCPAPGRCWRSIAMARGRDRLRRNWRQCPLLAVDR